MANPTIKNGKLILSGFSVTETAQPGDTVSFEIEVTNGAINVAPWDADGCAPEGYHMIVHAIMPDGTDRSIDEDCINTAVVGSNSKLYSGTFTAPEGSGDYLLRAYIELPGSEVTSQKANATLTVSEEGNVPAPTPPPSGGDPEDGDDGDNGDSGDGPFNAIINTALDQPLRAGVVAVGGTFLIDTLVGN